MPNESRTIPMSTDEIQELFLNNNGYYKIDLQGSKLKGIAFITYISNMQINCSLDKSKEIPTDEKLQLIKDFFNFRQTVKCDTLLETIAHILLRCRDIEFNSEDSWLSLEEMDIFIKQNDDIIQKASSFLDSSLVFFPAFNKEYREHFFNPAIDSGEITVIEDPSFIGVNILGLYTITGFLEHFLINNNQSTNTLYYYKDQVEIVQYNNKQLFDIILDQKGDSFLMSLCHSLFSSSPEIDKLFKIDNNHAK